ncbi:unnamed protein product [Prorocentrum cordatum]|uniref:Uncharacterized protein n=1 Tax=Prorocentrum cordatum TaxID=2364126 RepID=A0ABN9PW57_9DINO|nr:unnamed protein product [Polarella glacialis]
MLRGNSSPRVVLAPPVPAEDPKGAEKRKNFQGPLRGRVRNARQHHARCAPVTCCPARGAALRARERSAPSPPALVPDTAGSKRLMERPSSGNKSRLPNGRSKLSASLPAAGGGARLSAAPDAAVNEGGRFWMNQKRRGPSPRRAERGGQRQRRRQGAQR